MFYIVLILGSRLPTRQKHGCSFFQCALMHIPFNSIKILNLRTSHQDLDLGSQYSYLYYLVLLKWIRGNSPGLQRSQNTITHPSPCQTNPMPLSTGPIILDIVLILVADISPICLHPKTTSFTRASVSISRRQKRCPRC